MGETHTVEQEINRVINALRYEVNGAIADDVRTRVLEQIERARGEERARLRKAQDILWDRAHDRGVAIERARDRLHALVGHPDGSTKIDAGLRAIADALWASMQDAVPADERGEPWWTCGETPCPEWMAGDDCACGRLARGEKGGE